MRERSRGEFAGPCERGEYGWDVTVAIDDDIGAFVLLEFRPHRWLFGLSLPTVPSTV